MANQQPVQQQASPKIINDYKWLSNQTQNIIYDDAQISITSLLLKPLQRRTTLNAPLPNKPSGLSVGMMDFFVHRHDFSDL
jgi:hypothetical protein